MVVVVVVVLLLWLVVVVVVGIKNSDEQTNRQDSTDLPAHNQRRPPPTRTDSHRTDLPARHREGLAGRRHRQRAVPHVGEGGEVDVALSLMSVCLKR